jgi:hypothetical protein
MSNESKCPGHNRAECVSCCWPRRDTDSQWTPAEQEALALGEQSVAPLEFNKISTGYTAVDMATAAAQGFRDGAASNKDALIFAAKSLAKVTSGDGSGHADLSLRALELAGYKAEEAQGLVDAWKK